ncbi:hypothetical protein D3C84_966060 [compost metagenome]
MQHQLRVLGGHDRLEEQLEPPLIQRLVQQIVPGMMVIADTGGHAVIQARPARLALGFGLGQRLIGQPEHRLRRIAMNKGR